MGINVGITIIKGDYYYEASNYDLDQYLKKKNFFYISTYLKNCAKSSMIVADCGYVWVI